MGPFFGGLMTRVSKEDAYGVVGKIDKQIDRLSIMGDFLPGEDNAEKAARLLRDLVKAIISKIEEKPETDSQNRPSF